MSIHWHFDRLASRHQALIELGMINSPQDVPAFARDLWVELIVYILCTHSVLAPVNQSKHSRRPLQNSTSGSKPRVKILTDYCYNASCLSLIFMTCAWSKHPLLPMPTIGGYVTRTIEAFKWAPVDAPSRTISFGSIWTPYLGPTHIHRASYRSNHRLILTFNSLTRDVADCHWSGTCV